MSIVSSLSVLLKTDLSSFNKSTDKAKSKIGTLGKELAKSADSGGKGLSSGFASLLKGDFSGALNSSKKSLGSFTNLLFKGGGAVGGLSKGLIAAGIATGGLIIGLAAIGYGIYKVTQAAIGLTKQFASLVNQQFAVYDSLGKQADRFGLTTREMEAYRLAASQSGVSTSVFEASVRRMNKRLYDAQLGAGEATSALDTLGISAEDLNRQTTSDKLKTLADALKGVGSQQEKLRLTQRIFGDEAVDMLTLLDSGAAGFKQYENAVDSLGTALSRDQVKAIEATNDSWELFKEQIRGAAAQIATRVAPLMTSFFNTMRSLVAEFLPVAKQFGNTIFTIGDTIGNVFGTAFPEAKTSTADFANYLVEQLLILEFSIANWQELATLEVQKITLSFETFANDIVHFFTNVIPAAFTAFGNFTAEFFTNMGSNLGNLFSSIVESARSGFTDFKFVWAPLNEGLDEALNEVNKSFARSKSDREVNLANRIAKTEKGLQEDFKKFVNDRQKDIFGAGAAALDVAADPSDFLAGDKEASKGSGKQSNGAVTKGSLEAFSIINNQAANPQITAIKEVGRKQEKLLTKVIKAIEDNAIEFAVV